MLTLHGQVVNVFQTPEGVNKDTGEAYGGLWKVQLMAENILKNGQTRTELVDLTVDDPRPFEKVKGRPVSVPVGAFASGKTVRFFHLRQAESPVTAVPLSTPESA